MKDIIQDRFNEYACHSAEEEDHALREITQEVALFALSRSQFFEHAHFHGGTCLRIVHRVPRFSEDLDFVLDPKSKDFDLDEILQRAVPIMNSFGYQIEISGLGKEDAAVKKRFLKDDNVKKWITLHQGADSRKKIKIKVEVDTNPPMGAQVEQAFLDFPMDFSILCHDLGSLFAGKCHALLCREYVKGRDWFDFSWYVTKRVAPNYALLSSALHQQGPWSGKNVSVDQVWLEAELKKVINEMNWKEAVTEVSPFLQLQQREALSLWGVPFFLSKVNKLAK